MERHVISIRGIVQGVGFRPFIHNLAVRYSLGGFVQNRSGNVYIEAEGEPDALDHFLSELTNHPPPLSSIIELTSRPTALLGESSFQIVPSDRGDAEAVFLSPDTATCEECTRELFDPDDRRFRYPFLNCTNCGPRLTIIQGSPYDRPLTTMAKFVMCEQCRSEYENPDDRRFHAQPIACWDCGPRLQLVDRFGKTIPCDDPVRAFAEEILSGRIGAVRGLGGFHLACDSTDAVAVRELRKRKHRDEKPFALMVTDSERAATLCHLDEPERALLDSRRRPIVLSKKRLPSEVAEEVAPGNPCLGVMLPYTPVHLLLMEAVQGRPLVMTSGNRSDEPIAIDNDDALDRLGDIADVFLIHDRPIRVRCDDSVTRVVSGVELPVRRSRGYAPEPVRLPVPCPEPMLAVGGQLDGTFAFARERHAFVSHHMGDLEHYSAYRAFQRDIDLYEELFSIAPTILVHDLHPDYPSANYALERAERAGLRTVGVQHHHAHLASCMAEHGLDERVIGVCFDGTGYGPDGTVWGGEFLVGDYSGYRRSAHLRNVGLPGGDSAIREPWRMALSHSLDATVEFGDLQRRVGVPALRTVGRMLGRGLNCPMTSSAGRLFDAVASLIGLRDRVSYKGQAAIELEGLACRSNDEEPFPFELSEEEPCVIDTRPMIRSIDDATRTGSSQESVARRFHSTLAEIVVSVCERIREETGLGVVVLSGGVFLNVILTRSVMTELNERGFRVYRHRRVPPGDGGLSLGQLAVACRQVSPVRKETVSHVSRHSG